MIDQWSQDSFLRTCHHAITQPGDQKELIAAASDHLSTMASLLLMFSDDGVPNAQIVDRMRALLEDAAQMERFMASKPNQAMH